MGQAKQRGNREQRIAEAQSKQEERLAGLRNEFGLSADAKFCGYLIHNPDADEFLGQIEDDGNAIRRAFARTPELAHRFETIEAATRYCRPEKGELVVALFDTGDRLVIAEVS